MVERLPGHSRATIQRAIQAGHVFGEWRAGESVTRAFGLTTRSSSINWKCRAKAPCRENPAHILHEDDAIVVVDKRAGMIVHPAKGHWEGTLASALAHHFGTLSSRGGPRGPGIVHRLDRETSGVIVVAKNDQAHDVLAAQFKSRTVKKEYLAIVVGVPDRDRA